MPLKGNFETFFLASILELLYNDQKTGVLKAANEGQQIKVYIKSGAIVYAMGTRPEARLGRLLRDKKLVREDDLKTSLAEAKEKKVSVGYILVKKKLINRETLQKIVYQQAQDLLLDMFMWERGDFEYKDVKLNLKGMVVTDLNIMALILEASRRIDEMSVLRKQVPGGQSVFKIATGLKDEAEVNLNGSEWRILTLVDGKRTVDDIIGAVDMDEFTVYKMLYALISSKLIEQVEQFTSQTQQAAFEYSAMITIYNDILQVIRRNLEQELGQQTFTIFDECKPTQKPYQKELLQDFHPNNPSTTNIHIALKAMEVFKDFEDGRNFLFDSFGEFISNVLLEIPRYLGIQPTLKFAQDIEELLHYINKYHPGSQDKAFIIDQIQGILGQVEKALDDPETFKKDSNGLLGLFKKK